MRSEQILAFVLVAVAAGCSGREALLGTGTQLTSTPCDRCDPAKVGSCPSAGTAPRCFLATDGTCGYGCAGSADGTTTPPSTTPTPVCPALGCGPMCKYGVNNDARGCPTCQCNDGPPATDASMPVTGGCDPGACGKIPAAIPAIGCGNGGTAMYACQRDPAGACSWQITCGPASADAGMAMACPGVNPASQCPTTPKQCIPSSCSCTANGWACTADCGNGGPNCAPRDGGVLLDGGGCAAGACGGPPPLAGCGPLVCKLAATGKCGWVTECLRWYTTCPGPVCRAPDPSVPVCPGKVGDVCAKESAECRDPNGGCTNVICAASDPKPASGCPLVVSRAAYKRDIRYLSTAELARYREELLRMRLATWRYKQDPERERLGIIIDDNEHSIAVDAAHDVVDLYGYASLAVATVQLQAREIEALKRQLAALERHVRRR